MPQRQYFQNRDDDYFVDHSVANETSENDGFDESFFPSEQSSGFDLHRGLIAMLIGAGALIVAMIIYSLVSGDAATRPDMRSVNSPAIFLRGADVDRLDPGAQVLRESRPIGEVEQVGYESGASVAVLGLQDGATISPDEHMHVERISGAYVVQVTSAEFDEPVRFVEADAPATLPTSTIVIGVVALVILGGAAVLVHHMLKSYLFWIAAAVAVIVVLIFLSQGGFNFSEMPAIDQFHVEDFPVPNLYEE